MCWREEMFKKTLSFLVAAGLVTGFTALSLAQEEGEGTGQSAMEQLEDAVEDGQEAVEAETEEEAKEESTRRSIRPTIQTGTNSSPVERLIISGARFGRRPFTL
jgi:alpha-D-ribose 1-methylphosphonate 5-triphosphate diphosphatase PhnM